MSKMARTFLACDHCRRSKLRCLSNINEKGEPDGKCQRCSKHSLNCVFTPKPSQLKKKIKMEKKANRSKASVSGIVLTPPGSSADDTSPETFKRDLVDSNINSLRFNILQSEDFRGRHQYDETNVPIYLQDTIHNYHHKFRKSYPPHQLDPIILPNRETIIRVLEGFFNNQYHTKFNFVHKESYINWIKSDKFEHHFFNYDDPSDIPEYTPCTLLAILALCARYDEKLNKIYGGFNQDIEPEKFIPDFTESTPLTPDSPPNASRYFAYYSRLLLKDVFDTPSVQRVQSLTLLSSYEWTEGNSTRSYLYIGIAARMGTILGLSCKNGVCYNEDHQRYPTERERFIALESKRRTIWSVFMMDRCNSSGRNRSHAIRIEDIGVSLPCPEENFRLGIPITYPSYDECFTCLDVLTCTDFTIIAYELWSKISKWVGETGSLREKLSPNDPNSIFFRLSNDLALLKEKLPDALKLENSTYHVKTKNLSFGYLHQLLYLCGIFLNREYFYYNSGISKLDYIQFAKRLISDLEGSSRLISSLHAVQQFCITPFTAFQTFTNAVTCLSVASILRDGKLKSLGLQNMNFLKKYSKEDQLTSSWYSIVSELNRYLDTFKDENFNDKLKSSPKLNNLLNDYGDSDISERLSVKIPQSTKKIKLDDILNSNTASDEKNRLTTRSSISVSDLSVSSNGGISTESTSERSYITTATTPDNTSPNSSNLSHVFHNDNEIDKYFKNWDKIIPNWNDVFIEDASLNAMNTYIPGI